MTSVEVGEYSLHATITTRVSLTLIASEPPLSFGQSLCPPSLPGELLNFLNEIQVRTRYLCALMH